jgi:hypothetical protein
LGGVFSSWISPSPCLRTTWMFTSKLTFSPWNESDHNQLSSFPVGRNPFLSKLLFPDGFPVSTKAYLHLSICYRKCTTQHWFASELPYLNVHDLTGQEFIDCSVCSTLPGPGLVCIALESLVFNRIV